MRISPSAEKFSAARENRGNFCTAEWDYIGVVDVRMSKTSELGTWVAKAQSGDWEAFGQIVSKYQDMAVAYGYSILGDFHAAEDAAQEAFLEAYQTLPSLQNPLAFSGWFRCIIFKHSDRQMRRKAIPTVSLEGVLELPDTSHHPHEVIEQKELHTEIHRIINSLPETERVVALLYFMGQLSYQEIADFLSVPLSTVKKRLYSARQKLRIRMIELKPQDLQGQQPSRDEAFATRVREMAQRAAAIYSPSSWNWTSTSSWGEALASRIRLQTQNAAKTLDVAGKKGKILYGKPQDCLSVCSNYAHIARHNQLLLLDMAAAGAVKINLPQPIHYERPNTMESVWEFLYSREGDSAEQVMFRLTAVNEQIAKIAETMTDDDFNLSVETLLYERKTLRDLLLIILQQGSFASGQAWGIIKFQAYEMLPETPA